MTRRNPATFTADEVAARLDHAVLPPTLGDADLAAAVGMCLRRGVGCLCVRPCDVIAAGRMLSGRTLRLAAVVGFPHGTHRSETKALEAGLAITDGAVELDMVINIPAFLSGRFSDVRHDIEAVVEVARRDGSSGTGEARAGRTLVKVILETSLLTPEQIARACRIAEEAGADFVKTSTGFAGAGATHDAVAVMLDAVGGRLGVKASGGIRTWEQAVGFLAQGCLRLGVGDAERILAGAPVEP
jgi:deoxyribose-phosphate aldolase